MNVDISKPPPALPVPRLSSTGVEGVSLLPPLSCRGVGPGLIVLVPTYADNLAIKAGVPSLLRKWAEEGYTVVEVQEHAVANNADVLSKAIETLSKCGECEPKESVGLIAYTASLWNSIAQTLPSAPSVTAAIIYASASEQASLAPSDLPLTLHLSGTPSSAPTRTPKLTEHFYPNTSATFAIPFQPSFSYSTEAVSHTRNLTFLKAQMGGPIFDLEAIWEEHTYFEFENRSVPHTMATMVDEPYVNHIPTITGGIGRDPLTGFYANHFVFKNPADTELEMISRTVGIDRVVDEFIYKFTHDSTVDWLIPGIPPTGKKIEVPFTAIVNIRGDRLYHEHIAWDQGTVLKQLGLLPEYLPFPYPVEGGDGKKWEYKVPVAGLETAEKMREKNSVPSNELFKFEIREVGK